MRLSILSILVLAWCVTTCGADPETCETGDANCTDDTTEPETGTEAEVTENAETADEGDNNATDAPPPAEEESESACGDATALLTHAPTESLANIVPLGNSNPNGGHVFPSPHLYVYFEPHQEDSDPQPSLTNIVAPSDIVITSVQESLYITTNETDYSLNFDVCDEVSGYFKHIKVLDAEILSRIGDFDEDDCNEYSTGGLDIRRCYKSVSIEVSGGTLLGTAGGDGQSSPQYNFDFGLRDTRNERLGFINQTAFYEDWYYVVCPLDYYADPVKTELKEKLGYHDGTTFTARTQEPLCGTIAQDVPNTLKGNWLKEGITTLEQEDVHVAFTDYNLDPSKQVVGAGRESGVSETAGGPQALGFSFTPIASGTINRSFQDVTSDGTLYCYQSDYNTGYAEEHQEHVVVRMPTPTTLEAKRNAGSCQEPYQLTDPALFLR